MSSFGQWCGSPGVARGSEKHGYRGSGTQEVLSTHKMVMLSAQQGRCRGEKGPLEVWGRWVGSPGGNTWRLLSTPLGCSSHWLTQTCPLFCDYLRTNPRTLPWKRMCPLTFGVLSRSFWPPKYLNTGAPFAHHVDLFKKYICLQ